MYEHTIGGTMTVDGLAKTGKWLCLGGAALGALGLIGWASGTSLLTTFVQGLPHMTPNAALALLLIGSAGAARHRRDIGRTQFALSLLATLFVLGIGVGTLVEYWFAADLHIDHLLVREGAALPLRPSPPTALALSLLAAALLVFDVRATARVRPSEWLVLSAALLAFIGLAGIVFGAPPLYRMTSAPVIGVSLPTAISLLLTSMGLLLERPTDGIMRLATSRGPGSIQLRRLALPAVVAPVLLGLFGRHLSSALAIEGTAMPIAVISATTAAVGLAMLFVTAVPLNRIHDDLEASETRTRHLVEQAPDGIFVADLSGRYIDVNDAGCRILGCAREEILGRTIADLLHPDEIDRLWQSQSLLLEGGTHVAEWQLRRHDGSYVPVEVSARILPDGRWQGFVRDISARRKLEAALQASHADLVRAQSVTDVGSWRLDVRHDVLQWSEQEYRIFGVAPGTPMTYKAFLACVHPDDRAYVDREWTAALRGQPYDIEHRIVVDGAVRWVREKAELEFDQNRTLLGGIGVTLHITERHQREEQLRQAQERLDLALRGADLALWDWNVASGEVIFNQRWAEMRGYRADEIRGHVDSWRTGVHPEDWPQVQKALEDHFQGRRPEYETEHRILTKSGQWIWILDRGKVFARNERGEPIRMLGTELDITSRKQSEEALRLAEAKAAGILSSSADAIISIDDQQRMTLFNEGAEKIFGYSKTEAIGAPLDILIPARYRAVHRQHVDTFAASAGASRKMGARDVAIVGLRKNGEEFPADAAISKLEVGGTRVLTVVLRDVTEQKRLENEQKFLAEIGPALATTLAYDETLSRIAEIAARGLSDFCIVDLVDDKGEVHRMRVISREASHAWIGEVLRRVPLDQRRPHLVRSALESMRPVLMQRPSPQDVEAVPQNDEHLRALRALELQSLMVVPLVAHGRLLGALSFLSITPSRHFGPEDLRTADALAQRAALAVDNARLYRSAQRAIEMRDDVLGIVAHDLRNPLATILMQAGLLQLHGTAPGPALRESTEAIKRSATRMNHLIQDLLDVTRLEAGQLIIEQSPVPAADVGAEAFEMQRLRASSAGLQLRLDMSAELPEIWADHDRLLQVFDNLIGNAIKFTGAGGSITIGAAPKNADVLFWVSDTGPGIAAADQARLFDRFWQARTAKRSGAGLGLSIVKGIVEAHGGSVWLESVPGKGSTFFFTVPTAPSVEQTFTEPGLHSANSTGFDCSRD